MGAKEIAPALATIFRKSLETGNLPELRRLEKCKHHPNIFKKGDRSLPTINIPVPNLHVVCDVVIFCT